MILNFFPLNSMRVLFTVIVDYRATIITLFTLVENRNSSYIPCDMIYLTIHTWSLSYVCLS